LKTSQPQGLKVLRHLESSLNGGSFFIAYGSVHQASKPPLV
jgi:hypothetical protein